MLRAFVNSFKVPDLRNKILFTLLIIAVYRLGSHVPVPVVDIGRLQSALDKQGQGGFLSFIDLFSGGALTLNVTGNLTLDGGTILLGNHYRYGSGTYGRMFFRGNTGLLGSGEVIFGANRDSNNYLYAIGSTSVSSGKAITDTFTIGSGVTIHGNTGQIGDWDTNYPVAAIINQGTMTEATVAPRTEWGVARLLKDYRGGNATVGAHLTLVHREMDVAAPLAAPAALGASRLHLKAGHPARRCSPP